MTQKLLGRLAGLLSRFAASGWSNRRGSFHRFGRGRRLAGCLAVLSLRSLRLEEARSFGQAKDDHFFAGHGTDVMVHTQHLHANDLMDHRLQHRARQLQQLLPRQLDEVPSSLRRQ